MSSDGRKDKQDDGGEKGCCGKDKDAKPCCCGKSADEIDRDGCCDEDCCNRTCCGGRITCSLEAGFAATFAFLSFGAMLYANNSCDYVRLRGNEYKNDTEAVGVGGGSYSDSEVVAFMNRGIYFGQPVSNVTCLSWISINRLEKEDDYVNLDPWWLTSMVCAAAASMFGFAAMVQIFFVSCFPRKSQRFAARCASAMSVFAAILEGLTMLYLNSNAVKGEVIWLHHPEVDFTDYTLYISAWCAVASAGGWFITAFILCFLKNPPDPEDDTGRAAAVALGESNRSSRGSEKRSSTREQDEEAGDDGKEVFAQEEQAPAAAAGAAAIGAVNTAAMSSDEADTDNEYEDAITGSGAAAEAAFASASEHSNDNNGIVPPSPNGGGYGYGGYDASPGWNYYRKSADDFVDG